MATYNPTTNESRRSAEQAIDINEIPRQLERLEGAISRLSGRLDVLINQIEPIMADAPSQYESPCEEKSGSSVGRALQDAVARLDRLSSLVEETSGRLEL